MVHREDSIALASEGLSDSPKELTPVSTHRSSSMNLRRHSSACGTEKYFIDPLTKPGEMTWLLSSVCSLVIVFPNTVLLSETARLARKATSGLVLVSILSTNFTNLLLSRMGGTRQLLNKISVGSWRYSKGQSYSHIPRFE